MPFQRRGYCLAELSRDLERLRLLGESSVGYFGQGPTIRAISEMMPISIRYDKTPVGPLIQKINEILDII